MDVRIVAATNRNLVQGLLEGRCRSDLEYRLTVFPIPVPTLRERRDDIPALTRYFVRKYAAQLNRPVPRIPDDVIRGLQEWNWPGNVRELENFIERCMILTRGGVLQACLGELRADVDQPEASLDASEREHIEQVLRECGGVISGPNGAATRLGLKRTTLQSRLERMGISHRGFRGRTGAGL